MTYAIIKIGTNQYKVSDGDTFNISGTENKKIPVVLLLSTGNKITLDPIELKQTEVKLKTIGTGSDKIKVGRFRSKSRYDKVTGHKERYVKVKVEMTKTVLVKKPVAKKLVEKK